MIDDNAIMELAKNGDKEAFEKLVIRHRLTALRFAQKYVKEEFIAEDILQDSFALIYIKRIEIDKISIVSLLYITKEYVTI